MAVSAHFEEEAVVREMIDEVPLPPGVKLKRIDTGEDHSGDPAMWIVFGVSKSYPLTKRRVKALAGLMNAVDEKIVGAGMPKWPYVRFIDVK